MSALPQRRTVRLGAKDYELRELTFGDLADLQDEGVELDALSKQIEEGRKPLRQIGTLLWIACRRRDDAANPWRPDKEHFLHSMSIEDARTAMPVLVEALLGPLPKSQAESTA